MTTTSVSVCLPAYNEGATIGDVIREAHDLMTASALEYEILVCDDGSTDATATIVDALSRELPNFRVLRHRQNRGIRDTFEHLYAEASKDFVFLNSTDQQWKMNILLDMLRWAEAERSDIVIASRVDKHYGPLRRLISWSFNAIPWLLFGVRTFDAGAVKLMRREVIERCPVVSRSPFVEAERLIKATRLGYRITEYPVEVAKRLHGRSHGIAASVLLHAVLDIARVWSDLRSDRRTPAPRASDE